MADALPLPHPPIYAAKPLRRPRRAHKKIKSTSKPKGWGAGRAQHGLKAAPERRT